DLQVLANDISVQGHIVDSTDQSALAGVSLSVVDTSLHARTAQPGDTLPPNASGFFKITLPPGQYVFTFTLANYAPLQLTGTLQPGVQPGDLDVSLQSRFNIIRGFTKGQFGTTVEDLAGVSATLTRTNLDLTTTVIAQANSASGTGGAGFTLNRIPDGGYTLT